MRWRNLFIGLALVTLVACGKSTVSTTAGPGGLAGSTTVTDTATLSGGYKPTGTITFNLFPTADCSGAPVDTETVTVSGNGTFTTPTGYTPTRLAPITGPPATPGMPATTTPPRPAATRR